MTRSGQRTASMVFMRKRSSASCWLFLGALLFAAPSAGCQKVLDAIGSLSKKKPFDLCDGVDPEPWPWRTQQEGLWGEDPRQVPNFGYPQERRAPKMPDAERYMAAPPAATEQSLDDALLICQVEVAPRHGIRPTLYRYKLDTLSSQTKRCEADWDALNAPDVLLRFRFRGEYPISLFGPEDHWGFFVSIPHVRLKKGDELAVKLWDRDGFLDAVISDPEKMEYMGDASVKFDGTLPFVMKTNFFTMRCHAMAADQALALARWWLDSLDGALLAAENFRPDPNQWDFGDQHLADKTASDYGKANFRYAAGFIGWEHPEIQRRLKRLDTIRAAGMRLRGDLVLKLMREAPALGPGPGKVHRLPDGPLEITSVSCKGGCVAEATVDPSLFEALCASPHQGSQVALAGISKDGVFSQVRIELQVKGAWEPCAGSRVQLADNRTRLRLSFADYASLVWIRPSANGSARVLKLPL